MSVSIRPPQARSVATQARLLDATIACVVDLGYAGASTPEICRRAKVSRGAQLHHYPTKAELVAAAVDRLFAKRHDQFRKKLARLPADPAARTDAAIEALWEIYRGKTLAAWMELVVAARTDKALRVQLATVEARFFADAQASFVALLGAVAIDPQRAAAFTRIVLSCFDGLALHQVVQPSDPAMPAVLRAIAQLVKEWIA